METESIAHNIIASALRLPIAERTEVVNALQESLVDESLDHGGADAEDEVVSGWQLEIARRVDDIDHGRVTTMPVEEAERKIRGDAGPKV
jgi:putative addiction module component (TIGR02574 family)